MDKQNDTDTQKAAAIAAQNELKGKFRALYDTTPGLEQFERTKKMLLWGVLCFVACGII